MGVNCVFRVLEVVNNYIREISIAKMRIFGAPFGAIVDAFLSHFRVANFHTQKCQFLPIGGGFGNSKMWIPKNAPKRVGFGYLKNAIQPVICVPENGVCPVRGCPKWLKNDPKKSTFWTLKMLISRM